MCKVSLAEGPLRKVWHWIEFVVKLNSNSKVDFRSTGPAKVTQCRQVRLGLYLGRLSEPVAGLAGFEPKRLALRI